MTMKGVSKVTNIVEFQCDIQRTPEEAVQYLKKEIKDWDPSHILILCWKDDQVQFIPAAKDRKFSYKDIFWDVTGWLDIWRKETK